MVGTYTLREVQPKLGRVLLGLKKRGVPGKTGAEFEEGDFRAGLEEIWRLPKDTGDQGEDMYSNASW